MVHTCTTIRNTHVYTHMHTHIRVLDNIPVLTERKKNTEKAKLSVHKVENHGIKSQLGIHHHLDPLSAFPGKNCFLVAH